jgi:molecular chaperone GrpE
MDDTPQPEMIEKEKYLRLAADFENFKKRMEGELVDTHKFATGNVSSSMVDVMDHFDQALQHAPPEVQAQTEWFKGLQQTEKQFHSTLEKYGIKRIDTKNKEFNPSTMEAISMVTGGESGKVKEEVRAGYTMHDRVIRPARVIIYQ